MAQDVAIPKLGLTMEEGTVIEWHRADGERVTRGEPLFTVETDKVAFEVPAEADGFLQRIAALDTTLPVGARVGRLHDSAAEALAAAGGGSAGALAARAASDTPAPAPAAPPTTVPKAAPAAAPSAAPRTPAAAAAPPAAPALAAAPALPAAAPAPAAHPAALGTGAAGARLLISPVARRLAAERAIDPTRLTGSGPGGVILKRDVDAVPDGAQSSPPLPATQAAAAAPATAATAATAATTAAPPSPGDDSADAPTRRPLAGKRRAISQRMMASLAGAAQMTAFGRVDMAQAEQLRTRLVADAGSLGARITVTDLVLKCVATVLTEMPEVNASIDGDEIVQWNAVHLGLAVALDDGLVVPVIRHVDRLSLVALSRARVDLIARARAGRLAREDLQGGCFTLSNFGSYGGDFETPILNPPQSAMLGVGRITDEVVARDGAVVIRPMMWISMTFDHRLIDGAVAGRFRARLKALLEEPARLLATMR